MITFNGKRGQAKYHYGKRIYRTYKTLDQQRKEAEAKTSVLGKLPKYERASPEEMFQQVATFDDLCTILSLISGTPAVNCMRVMRALDAYNKFIGDPTRWIPNACYRPIEFKYKRSKKQSESKKNLDQFINGDEQEKPRTQKSFITDVIRDEHGDITVKKVDLANEQEVKKIRHKQRRRDVP